MKTSLHPDPLSLVAELHCQIAKGVIAIDPSPVYWESGVYSIVDCVFSSQTRHEAVVLPMLRERLAARSQMEDHVSLRCSDFLADIDSIELNREDNRFDAYGKAVLNLQVLGGRRKVEVCYEIASFFADRSLETMTDMQRLGERELLSLILGPLQKKVRGIGPALARYLAILLGVESETQPDVMVLRVIRGLSDWQPRLTEKMDMEMVKAVLEHVAMDRDTTPARLENALWRHASQV